MSVMTKTSNRIQIAETPLITGNQTFSTITDKVSSITEQKTPRMWYVLFGAASSLALIMFSLIGYLIWEGVGVWGVQIPVGWGWAIVNFVFWVGIGHAGTLISAVLFLFRQKWLSLIHI